MTRTVSQGLAAIYRTRARNSSASADGVPGKRWRLDPPDKSNQWNQHPVILLNTLDGIGCAKMALDAAAQKANCHILRYLAWETEEEY